VIAATLLTAASPLYWFTAARPLSDMAGLASAVAVQALTATPASARRLLIAAGGAGLGAGLRSQVVWLTVPVLALAAIERVRQTRQRSFLVSMVGAFIGGALVWAVPLMILAGGPWSYWQALAGQGAEDFSGVTMLWTSPTVRQLALTLYYAFIAPWGAWPLAAVILVLAALGLARLGLARRPALFLIAAAYGPYLVFDLLFQEAVTTRYALPLLVPVCYFAAAGAVVVARQRSPLVVGAAALASLAIGVTSVVSYARSPAPAFRMIGDMAAARSGVPGAAVPVLAAHRRQDLDLRRSFRWDADRLGAFAARLPAPPRREWLELVRYWNDGGSAPLWFVADPQRSDLALIASGATPRAYEWPLRYPELLGGVRPNAMQWHTFDDPAWYLGEGWALTPETAGVARLSGKAPGLGPIDGWVRRSDAEVTLMIGGRNLTPDGPAARLHVALDGAAVETADIAPGFFLRMITLPPGRLTGGGRHARLTIHAEMAAPAGASAGSNGTPDVAIEQFDARPSGQLVYGFEDGWHELEYNPATGRSWRWMSERGALRVRSQGEALTLTLSGETETFSRPSKVVIRAGSRVIAEPQFGPTFAAEIAIPAGALPSGEGTIVIETDQVYVPAEQSGRTRDRRHLGLKVAESRLRPAS
jgi:hypothetical protein